MTSLNTQLWELITNQKLPDDGSGRSFPAQLMADQSISRETADVAIEEYRKFMYLCATRGERNVPSQAVDLVWHLHMQHSRDYWDVFCRKLGKPVHHSPGVTGPDHLGDYKATVDAYKRLFGTPPKGIWRQSSKLGSLLSFVFVALFFCAGVGQLIQGDQILAGSIWTGVTFLIALATLHSLTPQGELTLVFECNDPFADDDAGDCGSGDGGGCGD